MIPPQLLLSWTPKISVGYIPEVDAGFVRSSAETVLEFLLQYFQYKKLVCYEYYFRILNHKNYKSEKADQHHKHHKIQKNKFLLTDSQSVNKICLEYFFPFTFCLLAH